MDKRRLPPWATLANWIAGRPTDGPVGDQLWARRTLYEAGIFFGAAAVMLLFNRFFSSQINPWPLIAIVTLSVWVGVRAVNRWENRLRAVAPLSKTVPDQSKTAPDQSKTISARSKTTPDQSKTTPDQSKTTPDQSKTTPDQSKTTPDK